MATRRSNRPPPPAQNIQMLDATGAAKAIAPVGGPIHPGHRPYRPYGAAEQLFYAHDAELLLVGPAGTGKTRAVLEKLYCCAQKYAGIRALLARKTRASLSQSVLVTLEEKVLPEQHPVLTGAGRRYRQSYKFANRSEFVTGSLDNADRLMSTEFDLIAAFEATELTLEDWEKLLSRLRHGRMPYQQAIADCNPSYPGHWLNRRAAAGGMLRLDSRHVDNPDLWDHSRGLWTPKGTKYMATLARLAGVNRRRLLDGHWAAAEGLVYDITAAHILPVSAVMPPLPAVRTCAGVDWGHRDPTAIVVGALCPDDALYLVEEYYQSGLVPEEVGRRIQALVRRWNIEELFCDVSRPEMIKQLKMWDLPARGTRVKRVDLGLAMVEQRLKKGRLKIYDCCHHLLEEALEYHYATDTDGRRSALPVPVRDHAMDALRYLVTGMDFGRELSTSDASDERTMDDAPGPHIAATDATEKAAPDAVDPAQRSVSFEQIWGPEG